MDLMKVKVTLLRKEYVALINRVTKRIVYLKLERICPKCKRKFYCAWICRGEKYLEGEECICRYCSRPKGCDEVYERQYKKLFDSTQMVWSVS